jgi:hypothetical protein
MLEPSSSASATPPSVASPRRTPKVFLGATWPFFFFVALCVGVAAIINTFTLLRCERADTPGGGMCHLDRGSMAFSYRESFFVDDLSGAQLNSPRRDPSINRRDLNGERVYLQVGAEQHRFIDNGNWDTARRQEVINEVTAFVDDATQPVLEVAYDRRLRVILWAFLIGLVLGGLFAGHRLRRLRLEDLE